MNGIITDTVVQAAWPLPTRTPMLSPLPTPGYTCDVGVTQIERTRAPVFIFVAIALCVVAVFFKKEKATE